MEWKRYPESIPEKSGYYLVLYDPDNYGNYIGADVERYYSEGDFIDCMPSDLPGTPEERFIDSIKNRSIHVEKAGFYTCGEDESGWTKHWEVFPEYWMELPSPPNSAQYV